MAAGPDSPILSGMIGGLDATETLEQPGYRPDAGGLVAMLSEAARRLDDVPYAPQPAIVMLARCFHGFAAAGLSSTALYEHHVPRPHECLPVAQECEAISYELIEVIGDHRRLEYRLDQHAIVEQLSDPLLTTIGPDLTECVTQTLRLARRLREVLDHLAGDPAAPPEVREVAAVAARSAEYLRSQYE